MLVEHEGAEVYRLSLVGDKEAETRAVRDFMRTWEATIHGPFPHFLGLDRELYMIMSELPMFMDRFGTVRAEGGEGDD